MRFCDHRLQINCFASSVRWSHRCSRVKRRWPFAGAQDREDPWHSQPSADLMTKHLGGKRYVMLCDLLSIKHISGQSSSAPKLTVDTVFISRASRALAALTLAKRATASEIAVHSGAEHETWIYEHRIDYWAMAGWITVVIMTCCIMMGLVLLWWKSGRVAETIDNGTQTLEEGS